MESHYAMARLGAWAVYRGYQSDWHVTRLGEDPPVIWDVLQEWQLGTFRPRANDDLAAWLTTNFPPEVPPEVAGILIPALVGITT
jgi:hypothetical protein